MGNSRIVRPGALQKSSTPGLSAGGRWRPHPAQRM